VTTACLHGDKQLQQLGEWFDADRFDQALLLVVSRRTRLGQVKDATFERIAFEMSSDPSQVRRYRSGECVPGPKSLVFIDRFLQSELGAGWMAAVDAALDEAGRNEDRPAHTAPAEGVF
jgi:hypothetical protein